MSPEQPVSSGDWLGAALELLAGAFPWSSLGAWCHGRQAPGRSPPGAKPHWQLRTALCRITFASVPAVRAGHVTRPSLPVCGDATGCEHPEVSFFGGKVTKIQPYHSRYWQKLYQFNTLNVIMWTL